MMFLSKDVVCRCGILLLFHTIKKLYNFTIFFVSV